MNGSGAKPKLTEKNSADSLFLIRGNMAVAAGGQGGVLVRLDPAQSETLVALQTLGSWNCAAGNAGMGPSRPG